MKTYLLTFWNSIRGFGSYQLLFRNPLKVTLVYWFLVCFVLAATVVSLQYIKFRRMLPGFASEVSQNLPEFSFKDGQTVTSLKTPVIEKTGPKPIVLDPDDKITRPPPEFTNGMFHIGKTKIKVFWAGAANDPWIIPIKGFPDGRVDRDFLVNFGTLMGYVGAPLWFVILTLVFYLVGLLQALFFATLVSFLEKTIQPSFTFEEMLNISIYALTPGALIVTVYWIWGMFWGLLPIPFDLVYFLSYIIFHVMGSGACRRSLMPPDQEDY